MSCDVDNLSRKLRQRAAVLAATAIRRTLTTEELIVARHVLRDLAIIAHVERLRPRRKPRRMRARVMLD